jgi:hypothetical protein
MPKGACSMLKANKLTESNFNQALLDAIDEGFSSLGNLPKETILRNLETHFQMKKADIPLNLAKLEDILKAVFGSGTQSLEKIITERLCEKLDLDAKKVENNGLVVCVDELKRQLLSGSDQSR